MSRFLLLPVEVANRELSSRLEIAKNIVDLGFIPIIGPKDIIQRFSYSLKSSKGFLDKGYDSRTSSILFEKIIKSGGFIYSLDEEGAVDIPIADFLNKRYSEDLFKYADAIFFWGINQYERFKNRANTKNKLFVTGNPRFVKKPKINFRKNNQITIVTNCGWGNNISGLKWVRKNYASRSKYLEEIIHNDKVKIKNFTKLIKYFSKNNFNIILRPHHEENVNFWENFLFENSINNIKIDTESNINKIIENSSCIFHCDSTVAIDANIRGVPVISLDSEDLKKDYLAKIAIDMSHSINISKINKFESIDSIFSFCSRDRDKDNLFEFFNISQNQFDPAFLICQEINQIQLNFNTGLLFFIYDVFIIFLIQFIKSIKYLFFRNKFDAEDVYALKHNFFWRKFPILSFINNPQGKKNYLILKFGKCLILFNDSLNLNKLKIN